jgi:hypothetical protein
MAQGFVRGPPTHRRNKANVRSGVRACSYGQKLSRLVRKLLDKFTSEISPWYENNMKSYTAFIYKTKSFPVYRDLTCWQARSRWPGCFSHMNTTFPPSGITFCRVSHFLTQLMFSATSWQPETLPGKRDNVSPYEQNKNIWLDETFSR